MPDSPATITALLDGPITDKTAIPAEVSAMVAEAATDTLFTSDAPTGRRHKNSPRNILSDLKLLKAVLVLNMNYTDAYDYAEYGNDSNTQQEGKHIITGRAMKRMTPLVRAWFNEQGLNKHWLMAEWLDMARHPEWQARKAALENLGKIQGVYAPAEIKHTVSVASKILEEIDGTSAGLPSDRD